VDGREVMKSYILIILLYCFFCPVYSYEFKKVTVLSDRVTPRHGPFGVYQSVMNGLRILKIPFNCNPQTSQVGDAIIVLSGVDNLRKAIDWKRNGRIKCLFGGPNIMNRPNQFNYLLASKEVDVCLVPSQWIKVAYEEDAPALKGRVQYWPAGVDVNDWSPGAMNRDCVLVYWKTEGMQLCQKVEELLRKFGYKPVRITYNSYDMSTYKNVLNKSKFAVFISRSESQGIALAEAWSMNVPTLAFDPGQLTYLGRSYFPVSSCPYLTEYTGKTWKHLEELETLIQNFDSYAAQFDSRKWVLKHMSYEASTRALLASIESVYH